MAHRGETGQMKFNVFPYSNELKTLVVTQYEYDLIINYVRCLFLATWDPVSYASLVIIQVSKKWQYFMCLFACYEIVQLKLQPKRLLFCTQPETVQKT